jgi:hypothetical protein
MAANTLANIAAAIAAGYVLEWFTRQGGTPTAATTVNVTRLKKQSSGLPGQSGGQIVFEGEGATSGAADTSSLANLNKWRDNRYGSDSAAVSASSIPDAAASPTTQGVAPTHRALTKDRD